MKLKIISRVLYFLKTKLTSKQSPRLEIKNVKAGDFIRINWQKIEGRIAYLKCLNNDPKIKKIFLEIEWANYKQAKVPKIERIIFKYNAPELSEFHLLNQVPLLKKGTDEMEYALLQKKLEEAINNEEYMLASELQSKINKLINNK